MDKQTADSIKRRLDQTILSMTNTIKEDIFKGVILPTVQEWFENNDSVQTLSEKIENNIKRRMDFLTTRLKSQLLEFSAVTESTLKESASFTNSGIDTTKISTAVTTQITNMMGMMGTIALAVISGGGGTALIASGPAGWIIGGIIGAVAFFLGKDALEEKAKEFIMSKKIPSILKGTLKKKIASQLKNDETLFEEQVFRMLQEEMKPIYKVLEDVK